MGFGYGIEWGLGVALTDTDLFQGERSCLTSSDHLHDHAFTVDGLDHLALELTHGIWAKVHDVVYSDHAGQRGAGYYDAYTLDGGSKGGQMG